MANQRADAGCKRGLGIVAVFAALLGAVTAQIELDPESVVETTSGKYDLETILARRCDMSHSPSRSLFFDPVLDTGFWVS